MKRIIMFVLFGIIIYAGIFVTVYGTREYMTSMNEPGSLEMTLRDSEPISGRIDTQCGLVGKKTNRSTLFGIPFGEETVTYFYAVPIGEAPMYLLFAVTDPEDIEAVENVSSTNEFSFTGIVKTLDNDASIRLRSYLMNNPDLIGQEQSLYVLQTAAAAHVAGYAVYVQKLKEPDPVPIIAGAAMILVGAGLAVLLTVRIVRERTGY